MRLDPLHLLVPLIVAAVAVLLLTLDTSFSACDAAQERFNAGQVAEAQGEIKAILADHPGSGCAKKLAVEAQTKVREGTCDDAKKALDAHLLSRALKGYQELLAANPNSRCGTRGVTAVVAEMCSRAAVLAKAKAGEAAQEAYTAILAIEPLATIEPCPTDGLASVDTEPGEPKVIVVRGADGTDGKDGTDGTDGTDGRPGRPGRPGKPGADAIVLKGRG